MGTERILPRYEGREPLGFNSPLSVVVLQKAEGYAQGVPWQGLREPSCGGTDSGRPRFHDRGFSLESGRCRMKRKLTITETTSRADFRWSPSTGCWQALPDSAGLW